MLRLASKAAVTHRIGPDVKTTTNKSKPQNPSPQGIQGLSQEPNRTKVQMTANKSAGIRILDDVAGFKHAAACRVGREVQMTYKKE